MGVRDQPWECFHSRGLTGEPPFPAAVRGAAGNWASRTWSGPFSCRPLLVALGCLHRGREAGTTLVWLADEGQDLLMIMTEHALRTTQARVDPLALLTRQPGRHGFRPVGSRNPHSCVSPHGTRPGCRVRFPTAWVAGLSQAHWEPCRGLSCRGGPVQGGGEASAGSSR